MAGAAGALGLAKPAAPASPAASAPASSPAPSPAGPAAPPSPGANGWDCCRICGDKFYPDFDQAYDPPYIQNDTTTIPFPAPSMSPPPPPDGTGASANNAAAASGFGLIERLSTYSLIEKSAQTGFGLGSIISGAASLVTGAVSKVGGLVSGLLGGTPPATPPPAASAPPPTAPPAGDAAPPPPKPVKEFRCCNICPYDTVQKAMAGIPPALIQLNLKTKIKSKIKAKGKHTLKQKKAEPPGFDAEVSLPPCCDFCRQIYFPKTPEAPTLDFPDPPSSLDDIREKRRERPSREWRILLKEQELKAREASLIETDIDLSLNTERRSKRAHHRRSSSSEDDMSPDLLGGLGEGIASIGNNLANNLQNVGTDLVNNLESVGQNLVNNVLGADGSSGADGAMSSTGDDTGGGTGVGFAESEDPFPPDSDACCHRCARRDATTEGIMFWGST